MIFRYAAQQAHAADRPVKSIFVGILVYEGIFISFIGRFSHAEADARSDMKLG